MVVGASSPAYTVALMPRFIDWLLRLAPTNPICMRLVSGGSRRARHLFIRSGYLALIMITLLVTLVGTGNMSSLRELASAGAKAFQFVSYLQLTMICLLAPIFMAGAIAQEANPRTWDILLTTPLNALQIVLGNLFGRLFFIVALLLSSLPLFAITQYFGGVPGDSIFASYAIAAAAALVVGAIAIALSVSRQAGRRAVFVFYVTVLVYLAATWAIDFSIRQANPALTNQTTIMTPLNPFLAQEVLLNYDQYQPRNAADLIDKGWITRAWMGSPVQTFCWLCVLLSIGLVGISTVTLRIIGQRVGQVPWYRRMFSRDANGNGEESPEGSRVRAPREVWKNPIAWREAASKQNSFAKLMARFGFVGVGFLIAITMLSLYRLDYITIESLRRAVLAVVATEVALISLTAINISATAISREREDGTLDILLTTPITPSAYISGKLKGIIGFVAPMMAVPIMTLGLCTAYLLIPGIDEDVTVSVGANTATVTLPFLLPEGVIILPLVMIPFVAFCIMIGLNWSLKSKGTIGSVIAAVGIVVVVVAILSLCGRESGREISIVGTVIVSLAPSTSVWSIVFPEVVVPQAMEDNVRGARLGLVFGAAIAAMAYSIVVYLLHKAMLGPNGRNFDMTVRRLAGVN